MHLLAQFLLLILNTFRKCQNSFTMYGEKELELECHACCSYFITHFSLAIIMKNLLNISLLPPTVWVACAEWKKVSVYIYVYRHKNDEYRLYVDGSSFLLFFVHKLKYFLCFRKANFFAELVESQNQTGTCCIFYRIQPYSKKFLSVLVHRMLNVKSSLVEKKNLISM